MREGRSSLSLKVKRALGYREVSRVNRARGQLHELPFDVRLRMLRRSRLRQTAQRLKGEVLWVAVFAAVAIIVATQLIVALVRA
jgi:hypothetical protein